MNYCCLCKHHSFNYKGETPEKKLNNFLKPYSTECKCDLGLKEHHYFSTFGTIVA